ncbi:MAG TPA: hypothetical protein VHW60_20725 [Caulobacteraceae bacterium]|jgi:hypothetical protein|nr:hypothetical protein [Caulobacteraceae bacterium]
MKNVQIVDGADNATFAVFQATDEEFRLIFPRPGQDLEIPEALFRRLGAARANEVLRPMWNRPILKKDIQGIHGTLFYNYFDKRHHLPASKREIDREESQISEPERELYRRARAENAKRLRRRAPHAAGN